MSAIISFLLQAVGISLSGVMAPGSLTAATVSAGARRRHAGLWVALGHGVIEFPLMVLIVAGIGPILKSQTARIVIGLTGGAMLLLMGAQVLLSLRRPGGPSSPSSGRHPLVLGVVLSGGNPYFLLWWATIGLALATRAVEFGRLAFAAFAVIHWLCDLLWLEALSLASHKGASLFGGRSERIIAVVCGAALLLFGGKFLYDAVGTWMPAGP